MVNLTYINNMSVDGYIEDRHGAFDFGPMDDDLFATYTELLGTVGTFLYGRRLYEMMADWETTPELAARSSLAADFARAWQVPSKIVYSTTLATVPTTKTRIERAFDIAAVQQLKADASRDLTVGGADLASQALTAGLVDECILFVWPVAVGGGKPALPADARLSLELLEERRFANGVMLLRYRPCLTVMSSGEGEDGLVPTVYVGPDRPVLRRIEVNGEVFEIRRAEDGGTTYTWVSGPNSGYGFGSSGDADMPEASHRKSILNFLGMIDPSTGYLPED